MLLWRNGRGRILSLTVVSIGLSIVDERTVSQSDSYFGHNKYSYPIMNATWCQDLFGCCPVEFRSNDKFTKMLTDFCFDRCYGFMGVKEAGIDEEKEKAEFTGPREFTEQQIDRIAEAVADALAENNNTKKVFLKDPLFYCPDREEDRCYWKNLHARLYKHIFVHACEADWIDLRKIANITKRTCMKKDEIVMEHDKPSP